jgi:hypothetical protein
MIGREGIGSASGADAIGKQRDAVGKGSDTGPAANRGAALRRLMPWGLAAACVFPAALGASGGPFDSMFPGTSASPSLKADTAVYDLETGILQYAFTFGNPSDTSLYLDCQVPPKMTLEKNVLTLDFDRAAIPDQPTGKADPDAYPPQRIGAHQTFQGQRKLDRILGDYLSRPKFTSLRLRMVFYPERDSGEGAPFVQEKRMQSESRAVNVVRRGKAPPPPPKVLNRRAPASR